MNDLIKSVSIENLLQRRAGILERFQQILTLAHEIKQLSQGFSPPDLEWNHRGHRTAVVSSYKDNPEATMQEYTQLTDQGAWAYLMRESGNLGLMDAKAKDEWQKSLDDKKYPELTVDNIEATFRDLHASRGEMFDRGVINVFKSLSWHYHSNSPFRLGKKIIVTYITGYSSASANQIDDLIRCFHVLDKKPEPAYDQRIYAKIVRFAATYPQVIDTEYVTVKVFGNGNGHCTFKRPDLVTKLNDIIARHFSFHIPHDQYAAKKHAA